MVSVSKHLDQIIDKHDHIANLQVAFVDIEKYSQRRTLTQTAVIDRFMKCLANALEKVSQQYVSYAQTNDVNFQNDIVKLPTGDGAAVAFSFDGIHDIHLTFAKALLQEIEALNQTTPCDKFSEQGWCNCHPNFGVRIGISEGRGIVYKDINSNYNVAGSVVNSAARVMNAGDRNQILFTDDAHDQIVDMVDDPDLVDRFRVFRDVRIKHNIKVVLHQYLGEGESYISSDPPDQLAYAERSQEVLRKLSGSGLPMPNMDDAYTNKDQMLKAMELVASTFSAFSEQDVAQEALELRKPDEDLNR